jgi:hypothetical protein
MAHFKLNHDDDTFIAAPQGGVLVFAGASGTETWIERDEDVTVRIVVKSVAVASGDAATLEVCLQIGEACAKGQDGPWPADTQLRASQSVQVVVKAGERLNFKAFPSPTNAKVLRTVVYTVDMPSGRPQRACEPANPNAGAASRDEASPRAS